MSIQEMAKAHLFTVQQTIVQLEEKKRTIEDEIFKLTEYLKAGQNELNKVTGQWENAVDSSIVSKNAGE